MDHILIIGAGAAGLMAAKELAGSYDVTIIEARSQLGGRIRSYPSLDSSIIEAGAEFIHGRLPLTLNLLKEAGIPFQPVEGKMCRREKGEWREQNEMLEDWDELMKKMRVIREDMTMHDFLELYFANEKYADLRRHVIAFTEGFDVADVRKVSVRSLYKEWSNEEWENFRIPGGYCRLIDHLRKECEKKGCRIITGQIVKQIDWERDEVTVYTNAEEKYDAKKAIITVSPGILQKAAQKASINFTPPLDDYIKAANEIGLGTVIKVVIRFTNQFWQDDTGFILSDEIFPTWWTQLPDTSPVLTGWAGGTRAQQMSDQTKGELLEKALFSLASIFEKPVNEIKKQIREAHVFNWYTDEYTLGAYSYAMPGTEMARKILQIPVAGTIFFAGEAIYDGPSGGTVEAALASGKEVAKKVKIR